MLEQSEVHPGGVVVVQRAERAVVDQLADLPHRPAKQEGVVHHDAQVLPLRQLDQLLGLRRGRGKRLFDEHVLAVLQRRLGQVEMRPDRRDDGHRIDIGRPQHLGKIGRQVHAGIAALRPLERRRALVAHRHHLAMLEAVKVPDDVRTPVAVTNHANAHRAGTARFGGHRFRLGSQPRQQPSSTQDYRSSSRPPVASPTARNDSCRVASDNGVGRHVASDDAPGTDDGPLADRHVTKGSVAPDPIDAPFFTIVCSTFQSAAVWSSPLAVVARGYESLMNITPWPMNT